MYQERVNRLTAKTDKLINSHKKAQQANNGNSATASPVFNHRSISLGNMGINGVATNSNGYNSSSGSSREKTPSIVEIPPSPVIKGQDGFGFNTPLNGDLTLPSSNAIVSVDDPQIRPCTMPDCPPLMGLVGNSNSGMSTFPTLAHTSEDVRGMLSNSAEALEAATLASQSQTTTKSS